MRRYHQAVDKIRVAGEAQFPRKPKYRGGRKKLFRRELLYAHMLHFVHVLNHIVKEMALCLVQAAYSFLGCLKEIPYQSLLTSLFVKSLYHTIAIIQNTAPTFRQTTNIFAKPKFTVEFAWNFVL